MHATEVTMPSKHPVPTTSSISKPTADLLNQIPVNPERQAARMVVRQAGPKVLLEAGCKTAAKTVARTAASPWLLVADGAELGTEKLCQCFDVEPQTARRAGKAVGLATSVGVGAAVGGPVGAGVGAAVWGIGEVIGKIFG
jgi:hypothetical protein